MRYTCVKEGILSNTKQHGLQLINSVVASANKTLVLINVVTLQRTRLVLGWVTIYEWINHLRM